MAGMAGRRLAPFLACLGLLVCTGGAGAQTAAPANGRLLIATGTHADPVLDGLDLRTGDRLHLVPFGGTLRGAYSPDGTKVAFHTNYDGDYEICVMNADGTHVRRLTHNSATDAFPTWSPDGTQIAFEGNRDGDGDVYLMNADGTGVRQVTHNKVDDILSDWQPLHDVARPKARALVSDVGAGTVGRLRFTSSDDTGRTAVYIVIFDGGRMVDYRTDTERRRIAGRTYSVGWRAPYRLSSRARFCVTAYDPSGNESSDSCAPIRVST